MASVSRRDSYGDKKTRPCGCGGNTGAWCHWTSSWLETFLPWWRTGIACRHSIFSPPEAGTTPLTVWSHSQTAGSSLWQCFSIIIWLPGDVLTCDWRSRSDCCPWYQPVFTVERANITAITLEPLTFWYSLWVLPPLPPLSCWTPLLLLY